MKSTTTILVAAAILTLPGVGFGTENDQLTREERDRVGYLYARVMRDEKVQEARKSHAEATRNYHDVLRQAMIERDPKVKPALAKIQMNPVLLAEAIWEKRNKDVLHNLHLPVSRLDASERKQWNQAMEALHEKEITKAFSKRLERNYRQQAKLRKEQAHLMGDFKNEARRNLLQIDPGLKAIFEKLDHLGSLPASDEKHGEDKTVVPSGESIDSKSELIPPMPIPMPAEEC